MPQPELAQRLRRAAVLAYPNTYPETSCIAVLEALAAGCRVVTSDLGALPETAGGFANLVPTGGGWDAYLDRFVGETVAVAAAAARLGESGYEPDGGVERALRRLLPGFGQAGSLWLWPKGR